MSQAFETSEEAESGEVRIVHSPYLKHIERTDLNAIPFALASVPVDNGIITARFGLAIFAWSTRMPCRPTYLLTD